MYNTENIFETWNGLNNIFHMHVHSLLCEGVRPPATQSSVRLCNWECGLWNSLERARAFVGFIYIVQNNMHIMIAEDKVTYFS